MGLELFFKDIKTMSRMRSGLFGEYLDSYAQRLGEQGYNLVVAGRHIHFVDEFGRWLKLNRVSMKAVSTGHIERYVRYRRRRRQPDGCDASAPRQFLKFLRERGVIPEERAHEATLLECALETFGRYLLHERALTPITVLHYRKFVKDFLTDRFGSGRIEFKALHGADVVHFVQRRAPGYGKRAKLMGTALRSFLRYLQYQGYVESTLVLAVPRVAHRKNAGLPRVLSPEQIDLLISSRSGPTPLERRDYAMLLLLARLGLRAGEIVSLTLDDIDWQEGCITVRGKGRTWMKMPLPVDVGEAIARYLTEARPPSKVRTVFLSDKAPISCLTASGLSTRVQDIINAVGIEAPNHGAHQFRHSLATNMLKGGASLAEIGELLRHRSTQTTEIYAKVDLVSLRQLALPWPGGTK